MSDPIQPGDDPGGPFWPALRKVARDVALGTLGDFIDGPPGWWWAGAQTALFLVISATAAFASDPLGKRAGDFLAAHGTLFVSFIAGQFAAWLGFKIMRRRG